MADALRPLDYVDRLRSGALVLRASERRVLDYVLAHPMAVTGMSVSELAAAAGVSEPTVVRCCRALECEGFRDFKIRLAHGLGAGVPYVHREISLGDSPASVADKIFSSSAAALEQVRRELDLAVAERVATVLTGARRVYCYGVGSSGFIALDAQQKFMSLGLPATAHSDAHLQITSAATLSSNDCALCFSFSGAIKDIVQIAHTAKRAGATVVAMTRAGTPLARECEILLPIDTHENTSVYAPMTSRLAYLAIVDVLATLVALRCGPEVVDRLRTVKDSLRPQRIDDAAQRQDRS